MALMRRQSAGGLPRLEQNRPGSISLARRRPQTPPGGTVITPVAGLRRSTSCPSGVSAGSRPSSGLNIGGVFGQAFGPGADTGSFGRFAFDASRSSLDGQKSGLALQPSHLENLDAVLFLDVDGVLHSVQVHHPRQQFDRRCMNYLVEIVKKSQATIVLSTAWRADAEARRMVADKLQEYGLPMFVSKTPQIAMFQRTKEILAWVRKYKPQTWVAIDDLPLLEENPPEMQGHFVQTRARLGLQQDTAERTIELFRQQKDQRSRLALQESKDASLLEAASPASSAAPFAEMSPARSGGLFARA